MMMFVPGHSDDPSLSSLSARWLSLAQSERIYRGGAHPTADQDKVPQIGLC
jgi:hypothetical protein